MHVFLLIRNFFISAVLVLTVVSPLSVIAQIDSENLEEAAVVGDEIQSLGNRYQEASDRASAILEYRGEPDTTDVSFFELQSISVWLLWLILLGLILLLFAVRRSLSRASKTPLAQEPKKSPENSRIPEIKPPRAGKKRTLVQPVKTVRIKVRKVSKK